ncbi:hypothetical protein [Polaribacter sp. SA4-12]|uniref:hypothetical protein n=1 Tax=Polaribacter sp. SA4-12 TaxID=1312072 RepID=UPI000B3D4042|nr:hypothetical protein [Polaribacter sp. SA4-12]ARV16118.1 hypothetical protein BTO07_13630 [Polaribacter sp. SA4-12]
MKTILNKIFFFITLVSTIAFTNCNNSDDNSLELNIQNKVKLLESSEWLLKGFEDRVMHTFVAGERLTYYGTDNEFTDEAIPGTQVYTVSGELLTLDFNFGNVATYEIRFSCDNTIVEFLKDEEVNTTLYKRNSNYKDCL